MDERTQRDIGHTVQLHAGKLAIYMIENKLPMNVGMAALALALATASRQSGFTRHEAISKYTSSVNSVYKDKDNG